LTQVSWRGWGELIALIRSRRNNQEPPNEAGAGKRMFIAQDAAMYLGLAPQTLAKLRWSGDSPPYFKVGRRVLYDREELDAWLNERRRKSTSDKGPA
jgi:helix-turn-helix protein